MFRLIFAYTADMGGERSSTTRLRLAGKICAICKSSLPAPHSPGERLCSKCLSQRSHRIYMNFSHRGIWDCQFLEVDLKTHLPWQLTVSDPAKIGAMAERIGAFRTLEDRQAFDHAIEIGRGGIWLQLTEEQYQKLKSCSKK